ncbi:hypothetical protein ACHWQZ_G009749 [Mnemiopsis leidyi]
MLRKLTQTIRAFSTQALGEIPVRQRANLVDSFNREHTYLRISITERCNLRCQYCMPLEGVDLTSSPELLTTKEILQLAGIFARQGVNKIRLTGGEPLINKDIVYLVEKLKDIDGIKTVALTTNGVTLARHLPGLINAGLDNVNISLDTLVPEKFEFIGRRPAATLSKVLKGIRAAIDSPLQSVKLNTVIMKGVNEDELCDFVALTTEDRISVRFLEFMPFSGNAWSQRKFIPYQAQIEIIEKHFGRLQRDDDERSSTSMNYSVDGHVGSIGFISSMSRNFCGGCNRLRLTHDGNLKVCLFGKDEVSLRDILRDEGSASLSTKKEEELVSVIGAAVRRKNFSHGGIEEIKREMKRPMILIGSATSRSSRTLSSVKTRHPSFLTARGLNSDSEQSNTPPDKSLSHVDSNGDAHMVDVGDKNLSFRRATATSTITLNMEAYRNVVKNTTSKGSVLTVAKIAGIQGAKQTSSLIPLCHQINLSKVEILFNFLDYQDTKSAPGITTSYQNSVELNQMYPAKCRLQITCTVSCHDRTGVEMEALVGASIAALTVYDMCKAVDKTAVIGDTRLLRKEGGKSGMFSN